MNYTLPENRRALVALHQQTRSLDLDPETIRQYRIALDSFLAFEPGRALGRDLVLAWAKEIRTLKGSLPWKRGKQIRGFLRWAHAAGYVDEDYHQAIPVPPQPKRKKRNVITAAEMEAALKTKWLPKHYRWLMLLGWNTGMSAVDCCRLKWEDVNLEQRLLTVKREKTGEVSYIPISNALAMGLEDCRKRWDDPVYVCPLTATKGFKLWTPCIRRAFGGKHSFHDFRTTLVTRLMACSVPVPVAMQMTGHKSVGVFAAYAAPDKETIRNAYAKAFGYATSEQLSGNGGPFATVSVPSHSPPEPQANPLAGDLGVNGAEPQLAAGDFLPSDLEGDPD